MFGLFKSPADRIAKKVAKALAEMQSAAVRGDWQTVAYAGRRYTALLAEYQQCDGGSEEHLMSTLTAHGGLRLDQEYADHIFMELAKRGLEF
ncbi:MAG: hypothetical protein Q8L55_02650 [Phycisphaerales bacterium]|nr:hypothetical protein [Phycisphaerales bacterium]